MDDARYAGLRKLPPGPLSALLAPARLMLDSPRCDPALPVCDALRALEAEGARLDLVKLFAHGLPGREATWWGCLAARDLVGAEAQPPTLIAAEAWVFRPGADTRAAVEAAMRDAPPEDATGLCALAAFHADPVAADGGMSPPGIVGMAVQGAVLMSLFQPDAPGDVAARGALLIERAFDIARGGSGRVGPIIQEQS